MGGYGQKESSDKSDSKTREQRKYLADALNLYGPQLGQNENVWQGERLAPLTDLQQKAITGAGSFADYFSTPQGTIETPLFPETGRTLSGLLSGTTGATPLGDGDIKDYFQKTYYDPSMQDLRENVNPLIDEAFSGPGFFTSARSNARTKAAQDVSDRLSGQWADLTWNVQNQNQALDEARAARAFQAVGPAIEYSQIPSQEIQTNLAIAAQKIGGLNDILGIGQQQQTQQQAEIQAAIEKFAEENQLTSSDNLSILLSLLGMNFNKSSGSSSGFEVNIK